MRLLWALVCSAVVAVLVAGCDPLTVPPVLLAVPGSLHPMYASDKDIVSDPSLLGEWRSMKEDPPHKWFFRGGDQPGTYAMGIVSEGEHSTWAARLVQDGDLVFLDLMQLPDSSDDNGSEGAGRTVALHLFLRLEKQGDRVRLSTLNPDWYLRQLELRRFPLKVDRLGENTPVITSPTEELRAFYAKVAAEPGGWAEVAVLTRPKPAPATPAKAVP